jgi:hypothetical protein
MQSRHLEFLPSLTVSDPYSTMCMYITACFGCECQRINYVYESSTINSLVWFSNIQGFLHIRYCLIAITQYSRAFTKAFMIENNRI